MTFPWKTTQKIEEMPILPELPWRRPPQRKSKRLPANMEMRLTCGNVRYFSDYTSNLATNRVEQLSNPTMLIKMLSCWMTWEAASHIASACKQALLDLQTGEGAIQEVLGVVTMVVATLAVVQGVVGLLGRGEPFFDNIAFDLLTLNTATEGTELPLKKSQTYFDIQTHCRFFVEDGVADEAAIVAMLV
jgi:succinate dehydrogenase hydrophobic anchor subunit